MGPQIAPVLRGCVRGSAFPHYLGRTSLAHFTKRPRSCPTCQVMNPWRNLGIVVRRCIIGSVCSTRLGNLQCKPARPSLGDTRRTLRTILQERVGANSMNSLGGEAFRQISPTASIDRLEPVSRAWHAGRGSLEDAFSHVSIGGLYTARFER